MIGRERSVGIVCGLAAAVSFGVSAPLAKVLVARTDPELLAGLLYGGAAIVLGASSGVLGRRGRREVRPSRSDLGVLAALVVAGGIVAPVLLLTGLARVSGVTGSLLLNLEAPFTMLLAVWVFGEHLGGRGLASAALILCAAALLGFGEADIRGDLVGAGLVGAACAGWALDNNLTQRLTVRDPLTIVVVKAAVAAVVNITIATARGAVWPGWETVAAAVVLGAVSYGASLVLDAYSLRFLGAAREAALFATAPFAGALLAIVLLGTLPALADVAAFVLMSIGVGLLLREAHGHIHPHAPLCHNHLHVHDVHHEHVHRPDMARLEPHSHLHDHVPVTHSHAHTPDVHHRHGH